MSDRHEKWVAVPAGHVIPTGQPYMKEPRKVGPGTMRCQEFEPATWNQVVSQREIDNYVVFVDSSWRPLNPCSAALNVKGQQFNCDRDWGHVRPHGNVEAGAIWDDEQPPESVEPTPERPPLELPTEPKWGIAVHKSGISPVLGNWVLITNEFHCRDCSWHRMNVLDFIPLTPEQVARIEAAR